MSGSGTDGECCERVVVAAVRRKPRVVRLSARRAANGVLEMHADIYYAKVYFIIYIPFASAMLGMYIRYGTMIWVITVWSRTYRLKRQNQIITSSYAPPRPPPPPSSASAAPADPPCASACGCG